VIQTGFRKGSAILWRKPKAADLEGNRNPNPDLPCEHFTNPRLRPGARKSLPPPAQASASARTRVVVAPKVERRGPRLKSGPSRVKGGGTWPCRLRGVEPRHRRLQAELQRLRPNQDRLGATAGDRTSLGWPKPPSVPDDRKPPPRLGCSRNRTIWMRALPTWPARASNPKVLEALGRLARKGREDTSHA